MKVHVLIATTRGVVAVQKLTDLEDDDLQSFISVRGTTQVLPITASYHNLVKKGTGIIQSRFGGSSYRADIAGEINQGNSWQLGLYVAHVAQDLNVLGDGESIQPEDRIIIASGELNTSEQTVQLVTEIPKKLTFIERYIEAKAASCSDICVLLPLENKNDVDADFPVPVILIKQLDEVENLMPVLAATADIVEASKSAADGSTPFENSEPGTKASSAKWVTVALSLLVMVSIGTIVLWQMGTINNVEQELPVKSPPSDNRDKINSPKIADTPEIADSPETKDHRETVDSPETTDSTETANLSDETRSSENSADTVQKNAVKNEPPPSGSTKPGTQKALSVPRLKAQLSLTPSSIDDFQTSCSGPSEMQTFVAKEQQFQALPLDNLCALRLYAAPRVEQVLLVSLDTGYMAELERSKGPDTVAIYRIPLPTQRSSSRTYWLLLSALSSQEQTQNSLKTTLKTCLAADKNRLPYNEDTLAQCLKQYSAFIDIVSHTLEI